VVPELLPDLAIIDAEELPTAVQAQVVQPLDDLVSPDLVNDLYPFARAMISFDGQLMGLLYRADLDHMVYNTGKLTVPPRSWPGVLSDPGTYIFAAGGQGGLVNDSFLVQYLAVHPWPADAGEPFLEESSLIAVLQFYQDGVTQGVFPLDILDYHTTEECWPAYAADMADLTHASAHRYLVEGQDLPSSAVAPIPAINGAASAIGRGWALVLVTNEPNRQALAVEFMVQFLSPATNAAWNRAVGYLPTRQSALANAAEDDSYARFIHQQLMAAQVRPRLSNYAQVAAALQEAVEDVVTGAATPEEAAQNIVGSSE
jgi:multiple sugar transport system substrate-binding protein